MYSENTFVFCLDHLLTADPNGRDTKIILSNGREEILPIDIEDFCANVFSDIHEEREYQLIEIDNKRPESDNSESATDIYDALG